MTAMPSDARRPPARRPSVPRLAAALATGLGGTFLLGAGAGLLAIALRRSHPAAQLLPPAGLAVLGLLTVVAAIRLARLPWRRGVIALLGALLLVTPIARTVRDLAGGSTAYPPAKRTMADLRNLGFALESRAVDEGGYPPARSLDELAPALEGRYLKRLPRVDAWGRPLRFLVVGSGAEARYFVGSAGADGRWQRSALPDYAGRAGGSGDDIVFTNGGFAAVPR